MKNHTLPTEAQAGNPEIGFYLKDGLLYCEGLRVKDIQAAVMESPFYLYSRNQIIANYQAYANGLANTNVMIGYAVKANHNLAILKQFCQLGCGAVLASGNELKLARLAGFAPERIIYNGNGKTWAELLLAVETGIMVNIDSEFDLAHVQQAAQTVGKSVNVLLRINPDIDPGVHPYISTGLKDAKFGIQSERLNWFLQELKQSPRLNLVGLHCHLGSGITELHVFRDATMRMLGFVNKVRAAGFNLAYLNLGGGLGIDYTHTNPLVPTPKTLLAMIGALMPTDLTLILEPGRSLIANAAILVNRVIGVKSNGRKHFIVTDGSSAEFMRPSLYNAYHHIGFTEPINREVNLFDIVGPLCDSGDFLGKERQLPTPPEGVGLVVYDVGAYGHVTCTTANVKLRPPEYLVDATRLRCIRRAETFDEYAKFFEPHPELPQQVGQTG